MRRVAAAKGEDEVVARAAMRVQSVQPDAVRWRRQARAEVVVRLPAAVGQAVVENRRSAEVVGEAVQACQIRLRREPAATLAHSWTTSQLTMWR